MNNKLIILISMLVLMTTMVLAVDEPYQITDIGDTVPADFIDANTNFHKLCVEAGTKIICSGVWENSWPYDMPISYADWENPDNGLVLIVEYTTSPANDLYNEQDCFYYETNGRIYCAGHEGGGVFDVYSFLPTGADDQDHTGFSGGPNSNVYTMDLRPGTDEIYMFNGFSTNKGIWKYDIGGDVWNYEKNLTDDFPFPKVYGEGTNCKFTEDGADLVCIGGRNNTGGGNSEFMVYNVAGKTVTFHDFTPTFSTNYIRTYNGVLYAFVSEDAVGNAPRDDIFYIDPSDWSTGTLTTTLPVPLEWAIVGSQGDVDYIFDGYTTGSAQSHDVYKIEWAAPVVEEPVTTTSGDNTAGNLAYIQSIQKAKAAQSKQVQYNPIEQFIMNLRNWLLSLFGHEVN